MKPFSVKTFVSALLLILAIFSPRQSAGSVHSVLTIANCPCHFHSHLTEGKSTVPVLLFFAEENNNNEDDETCAKKVCAKILHGAGLQPETQLTYLYKAWGSRNLTPSNTPIFIRNGVFRI